MGSNGHDTCTDVSRSSLGADPPTGSSLSSSRFIPDHSRCSECDRPICLTIPSLVSLLRTPAPTGEIRSKGRGQLNVLETTSIPSIFSKVLKEDIMCFVCESIRN